jgi:tRNA G18 (ribose-2'-O)-methylase SpoU
MAVLVLDDVDDERLEPFRHIGDPHWLSAHDLFVIEGRLVVTRLLALPLHVRAVLVTSSAHDAVRPALAARRDPLPVYVVPKTWMERLTGFNLHQGCLAVAERPPLRTVAELLESRPQRLLVLERIANPDNIGALFRNGLAFGVDGIVLGPDCGDPLYRKAVRVSCGACLSIPFAKASDWPHTLAELRAAGLTVLAMTPAPHAASIDGIASSGRERIALLLGAEGDGLSAEAMAIADARVRIPIAAGADSLNVGVAAAIALHVLSFTHRDATGQAGSGRADNPPTALHRTRV